MSSEVQKTIELSSMPPNLPVIASGGEAVIYKYSSDIALKIYKKDKIQRGEIVLNNKQRRIEALLESELPDGPLVPICKVTYRGDFVGFGMKLISNSKKLYDYLDLDFMTREGISNRDILELLIEYAKLLRQLNKEGWILGDICPYNTLVKDKGLFNTVRILLPDVDSWGKGGIMQPDAFKEDYAAPESYRGNNRFEFSEKTDQYAFAIMAFYILTKIHPFGGTLLDGRNVRSEGMNANIPCSVCGKVHDNPVISREPVIRLNINPRNSEMETKDRMREKFSLLGDHNITIPKFVKSWQWMSPQLLNVFLEIFEGDKRSEIIEELEELYANMEFCPIHKLYYYSKYESCPICNPDVKITHIEPPKIIKVDMAVANAPKISELFIAPDVDYVVDRYSYVSINNELIHIGTNRKVMIEEGKKTIFTRDGEYVYFVDENSIDVCDAKSLERKFLFPYPNKGVFIQNKGFYYINDNDKLIYKNLETQNEKVIMERTGDQVFFAETTNGRLAAFALDFKDEKGVLSFRGEKATFPLIKADQTAGGIVKYDPITTWAMVMYKRTGDEGYNVKMYDRTMKKLDKVLLQDNVISLPGTCFHNGIVYATGDKVIYGINCAKNEIIEFACDVVTTDSKIEFSEGGFVIITEKAIYRFGN